MNIYMTTGTPDFMETLKNKHASSNMIHMYGESSSLLLHETDGKTVFQTPRRYEVISSVGNFEQQGYFALHNFPVTDEGRPLFEHSFQNTSNEIEKEPGFIAFRLLRPLDSDSYIVMTEWADHTFYALWKNSPSFAKVQMDTTAKAAVDSTTHLFTSAAYTTTYWTKNDETNV